MSQPGRRPMTRTNKPSTNNPSSTRAAVRQLGRRLRHPHRSATAPTRLRASRRQGSPSRRHQVLPSSPVSRLNRSRMDKPTRTVIRRPVHTPARPMVPLGPQDASDPRSRLPCCGVESDRLLSSWQ